MENKTKSSSPLVVAVLALDQHFAELERLGAQIEGMELTSDFDIEKARQLMARFAECGENVSAEVVNLSQLLQAARAKAESTAQMVGQRAEQLNSRKTEQQQKFEAFRMLGEKVRALSVALGQLASPQSENLSPDEREAMALRLADFESQLHPLIAEAQMLKKEAQDSKMKTLERNADALSQCLQAASQKLSAFSTLRH